MDKCPHCGSDEYYFKQYASGGVIYHARFDGKEADNTEMHQGLNYKYRSQYIFCNGCDRRLCKINDMEEISKWENA